MTKKQDKQKEAIKRALASLDSFTKRIEEANAQLSAQVQQLEVQIKQAKQVRSDLSELLKLNQIVSEIHKGDT